MSWDTDCLEATKEYSRVNGKCDTALVHRTCNEEGFSPYAFFLGPIYYAYRKMYVEAAIFWAVTVIVEILLRNAPFTYSVLAIFAYSLIGAMCFYPLYAFHIERKYERYGLDNLKKLGGVSYVAAAIVLGANLLSGLMVEYLG